MVEENNDKSKDSEVKPTSTPVEKPTDPGNKWEQLTSKEKGKEKR